MQCDAESIAGKRPSRERVSGFTLIELLVVISIVALLMAVLLPVLSRARTAARAVVCQSNLKQWGATLNLYAENHEGRFPTDFAGGSGIWLLRGAFLAQNDPNAGTVAFHGFGTKDIACCPAAAKPSRDRPFGYGGGMFGPTNGWSSLLGTVGSASSAWEITEPAPAFHGSYGINAWVFRGLCENPRKRMGRLHELDVLSLGGRANIPVLLDAALMAVTPRNNEAPPETESRPTGELGLCCLDRHSAHVNSLFLDWSVRKVGLKELWTLKWYDEFDRAGKWTKAGGVQPEDWPVWMRGFKEY